MKFFKNYVYNLSYQILAMILPIITVPYIVSHLTQSQIGINSFVLSNTSYFTLFGMLGLKVFGTREISKIRDDKIKITETFSRLYYIQLMCHIISLFVYILCFQIISRDNHDVYLLYTIMILASTFDISWLYQGLENFKFIASRNLIIKISSVVLLFIFVKTPNDFYKYILILYLPELLVNIIMWFQLTKIIPLKSIKLKFDKLLFYGSLTLFFPQIASSIYTVLDKTMVGIFSTMNDLALYDQAQKIIRIALTIISSFSAVMMPRISLLISKNDYAAVSNVMQKSAYFMWYLAFGMCFGLISISDIFVPWFFGEEYMGVIPLLKIGALLIIPVAGANLISVQFLIPLGKQNLYTITLVIASISNVLFNTLLIPYYGSIGATIASIIAECVGFLLQVYIARKFIKLSMLFSQIYKAIIAGGGMYVILYSISARLNPGILNTILIVIMGISIYTLIIFILNYGNSRMLSINFIKKRLNQK